MCLTPGTADAPEVPIENVNGPVLGKVIEFISMHAKIKSGLEEEKYTEDDLTAWDSKFLTGVDQQMLFDIALVRFP
jgi:hypothetical protein